MHTKNRLQKQAAHISVWSAHTTSVTPAIPSPADAALPNKSRNTSPTISFGQYMGVRNPLPGGRRAITIPAGGDHATGSVSDSPGTIRETDYLSENWTRNRKR